jgi:hypothetical protein
MTTSDLVESTEGAPREEGRTFGPDFEGGRGGEARAVAEGSAAGEAEPTPPAPGTEQTTAARPPSNVYPLPTAQSREDRHFFADADVQRLRSEWSELMPRFVDEPRETVERADELVATALRRIAEVFADEKRQLEAEWSKGGELSTEDLRQAIRRYRAFFDRLLSV